MKSILFRSICCAAILGIVAGCGNQKKKEAAEAAEKAKQDSLKQAEMIQKQKEAETLISQLSDEPVFDIVTNLGTIKVKLYSKTPKHRANFEKLALSGFYDGLLFHRVIDGFMIQGGDPNGTGMGGPGYSIKGEFAQNGVENNLVHDAGVLSMARAMHPDSAGSQFFIMHKKAPHLDGAYAAFGKITEGMDVVNKIAETATDYSDRPLEKQVMKKVTVETFGEDYPEPETV